MSGTITRWGGIAAIVGGASWIVYYATFVAISAPLGRSVYNTEADVAGIGLLPYFFGAALIGLGIGIWGLRGQLSGRHPVLGYAGAAFGSIAIAMGLFVEVRATGILGPGNAMGGPAGIGVVSMCLGTILVGIATLRAHSLSGAMRHIPLILGVVTFPTIVLIPVLGAIVPGYLIDELPFALCGLTWIAIGRALLASGTAWVRQQFAPAV